MAIIKKDYIDNSIFQELITKYPPLAADNNVLYKQKLDYLTFETDFLSDAKLRKLRYKYGNDIIAIIFFLRTEMCHLGWKIRIDNEYHTALIDDCAHACNVERETAANALNDLLQENIFFAVKDESVEQGVWLTCPQQIYNYEMACNNRKKSRARKAKSRANAKEKEPTNAVPYQDTDYDQNGFYQDMDYSQNIPYQDIDYGLNNPYQDMTYNQEAPCQDMGYDQNQFFQDATYSAIDENTDLFSDDELPFN